MKNEILKRDTKKVDMDKSRVYIGREAVESLGLTDGDNKVVITIYNDKVVITKKKGE